MRKSAKRFIVKDPDVKKNRCVEETRCGEEALITNRFRFLVLMTLFSGAVKVLSADGIRIVEVSGAELKWADVKVSHVVIPLTLENTGSAAIRNVQIDVTPFSGSGHMVKPDLDRRLIASLEPGKPQLVTITATLPSAVTYRSILRVRQKSVTPITLTIEIARTRGAVPIELTDAQAQPIEIDLLRQPQSATFNTIIVGSGEELTLAPPILKGVTYRTKAATTEPGFGTGDLGLTVDPDGSIEVRAGDDWRQPVKMTLTGIRKPGRYDALVSFGGGSMTPMTTTLTVYARQSWCVAAGCILAGVIVSLFLRFFGLIGRPSLLNRERANALFRELDESSSLAGDDAYAIAVVQDVRRDLAGHFDDLSASRQLMNSGVLDVYAAKIAALLVWVQMRRRVKRLEPASIRAPFEDQLRAAEAMLLNRVADAAAASQQFGALVEDAIEDDDYTAAAAELDRLQRRHIRILADDLATRIGPDAPVGVHKADWSSVIATVTANLTVARNAPNAADASDAFRAALTTFLRAVIAGLAADVADKHDSTHAAAYAKAAPFLDSALALLEKGEMLAAWRDLEKAQQLHAAAAKAASSVLGPGVTALIAAASAPAALSGFDLVAILGGAESSVDVAGPGAMRKMRAQRLLGESIASVLILLGAILIGLQTLWIDQLTWGGWPSMIAAFLWGVAFDQFSHAGLNALIRRT
jgi:hypothetical protein